MDYKGIKSFLFIFILTIWFTPAFVSASVGTEKVYNLAGLVKEYILENTSRSEEDVRIEFLGKLLDVSLKGEKISYDVDRYGKDALIGDCNFTVRFYDNGVQIARYQVRADIEIQESYLMTTRVVKKNDIITPADVQVMHRWVRTPSLKSISDAEEVIGKRLIVNLAPEREIKRAMIKEPVLVKKGEVVRIVLDQGQMSLLATGVAEEEGVDRQRIRVRNLSSQKVIQAKVMAEGLVRVELF